MTTSTENQSNGTATPGVLASFEEPEFRKAWLGAVLFALGMWIEWLAIGWFLLNETGSVFLAALSFGIRTIPNLILGPIGGAISDRLPRARVLTTTAVVRTVAVVLMSLAVFADFEPIPILFILVFVMGSTIAFQNTALQPLQADIVGSERLGNAISVTSFGQRSVGVVGALSGGVLIGWLGPAPTFLIAAVPLACAALMFASVRQPARHPRRGSRFIAEVVEGLRMIVSTPMVRLLLGMMILVEILGFSYNGLLPAIADRVLNVGPERLGILTAGASVGSMFGALILVLTADRFRRGLMLIGVFVTFGALLMVLGNSTIFWLSVVAVAGIGASAAMVDVLEWIMLQDSVPDELRGRALGGWNFAIGWGWIGPIALGAIAEATNVPTALTLSGAVLLVSAMVTFLLAKSLRVR